MCLRNVVRVIFARDLFHDRPGERQAGVAVGPTSPGRKERRVGVVERHELQCAFHAGLHHLGGSLGEEITESSGVGEEHADSDLAANRFVRVVGEELSYRVAERDLALIDELPDQCGGEHLAHRPECEARRVGNRRVFGAIRVVGARDGNDLRATRDGDDSGKETALCQRRDLLPHIAREGGVAQVPGERRFGRRRWPSAEAIELAGGGRDQ